MVTRCRTIGSMRVAHIDIVKERVGYRCDRGQEMDEDIKDASQVFRSRCTGGVDGRDGNY